LTYNDQHQPPGHQAKTENKKALSPVGWMLLLTHQFIIVFMAADPKPQEPIGHLNGNRTVMQTDSNRPKTASLLQV